MGRWCLRTGKIPGQWTETAGSWLLPSVMRIWWPWTESVWPPLIAHGRQRSGIDTSGRNAPQGFRSRDRGHPRAERGAGSVSGAGCVRQPIRGHPGSREHPSGRRHRPLSGLDAGVRRNQRGGGPEPHVLRERRPSQQALAGLPGARSWHPRARPRHPQPAVRLGKASRRVFPGHGAAASRPQP